MTLRKGSALAAVSASLALALGAAPASHATMTLKNGTLSINVNGSDGGYPGGNASGAGDVTLRLSYADAQKTQVQIDATTVHGRTETFSQAIPLEGFKGISIRAIGGSGGNGYGGGDGRDGSSGSSGMNGCPPSAGSNGSDGTNGTDGGPGGNGGRGGVIRIEAPSDQTELTLMVAAETAAGSGGYGGSGGRGGRGGQGGQGGQNTCKDDKGNPVWGPNGSQGSSGRDGSSGYNGSSGNDGRAGSIGFISHGPEGDKSYKSRFELSIAKVVVNDAIGEGMLEPGENLEVSEIDVVNKGAMPTPAGQALKLVFADSPTLVQKTGGTPQITDVIAGGATQSLTFPKGALTFQVPDDPKLIGKKVAIAARLGINLLGFNVSHDSGLAIHWPLSFSAASSRATADFEVARELTYTLKNATPQVLGGPQGVQPVFVQVAWDSKNVPASDVWVALKDGRVYSLAQPVTIPDLVVPAKGKLDLKLSLLLRYSQPKLTRGAGTLTVGALLNDPANGSPEEIQSSKLAVTAGLDASAIARDFSLDVSGITCEFPGRPLGPTPQVLNSLRLKKVAGQASARIQLSLPQQAFAAPETSPAVTVSMRSLLPFLDALEVGTPATRNDALVQVLNKLVSPALGKKSKWSITACAPVPPPAPAPTPTAAPRQP